MRAWRRLRALGAVALKKSVYLLPFSPDNYEQFQWLTQEVEKTKFRGEARLLKVDGIENMKPADVIRLFQNARDREYEHLAGPQNTGRTGRPPALPAGQAWASDPRFATNAARVANKDELLAEIAKLFLTASKGEWIDRLEAEGVPCAVINALPDAVAHPQAQALGIVQRVPGDDDLTLIGLPLSFDGARPTIRRASPRKVGEHDGEVRAGKGRWP